MGRIIVAERAGFCFGVDNAVKLAFQTLRENPGKTRTFGELIHNRQISDKLTREGVHCVQHPEQLQNDDHVVIRAHGIGEAVYESLKNKQVVVHDATCPYVKRIHKLVREKQQEGYRIIIVGDDKHPEVIGINGWCGNRALIVSDVDEVEAMPESEDMACVVAQTTMKPEKYEEIYNFIKKKFANVIKFDTICSATEKRQQEAREISELADVMIVIGGTNSSNTQKLYEICSAQCPMTIKIKLWRIFRHWISRNITQ